MSRTIDLGLFLVDHPLLDSENRRCGNVDDLELEGGPGERLEVVAIVSGPGVWRRRAPLIGRLASWIGGGGTVRIPWQEVDEVAAHVKLCKRAETLGLGRGEFGKCHDLRASLGSGRPSVDAIVVGRRGSRDQAAGGRAEERGSLGGGGPDRG